MSAARLFGSRLSGWSERLQWEAARCWQRLGYLELLVIAIGAVWLALEWQVLHPLRQELQQQQLSAHALLVPQASGLRPAQKSIQPLAATQQEFLAFLPELSQREQQLSTLHELARPLSLARLDFSTTAVSGLPVQRLTVRFAVQGRYSELRRFIQKLLTELPNLSVASISLNNSDQSMASLILNLEVNLYFRQASTEAGP